MQSAETVLDVIRERGRRGLPLERVYRQLFNPQLFLTAYGRIYSNTGAMTPGVSGETADGMSTGKIDGIINALRAQRYRWSAARRTYIPKKNGKMRPLGMPTWSDKLVAEVVRLLLDAYYDVQFSDRSHGFRPGRGCHTALTEIQRTWTGTKWFIEGDISDYFGSMDHDLLLARLREKIHDERFLGLIRNMLRAGYLEDWRWNATLSGCPQGGIASPVLSNIYLDMFDQFVEQQLIPEYTRGEDRRRYLPYKRLQNQIGQARKRGDWDAARSLRARLRTMPSRDPDDPDYRRLRYVRYADDWLLGFSGPRREAEEIKHRVQEFLKAELRLDLSEPKTLITHAATQSARFLGYEIRRQQQDTKITGNRRSVNGAIGLYVPRGFVRERSQQYMSKGRPVRRGQLLHDDDFSIVAQYGIEWRGYAQYYVLALDTRRLTTLQWVMEASMLRTLAAKHQTTLPKMARKYKAVVTVDGVRRKCYEVRVERDGKSPLIARMGGFPLTRQTKAILVDRRPPIVNSRSELLQRLAAEECEHCGSHVRLEVHHIRRLADLNKPGQANRPWWISLMASRRRKTLVLCQACHGEVHAGRSTAPTRNRTLESRVSGN
jgi:group II intron reverse transcriptase/maturase